MGIYTPIDGINDLVDDTLGKDSTAGKVVKCAGAGIATGVFALAVGATGPVAGGIAAGVALSTAVINRKVGSA
ncbi:hypothetical protein BJP36_26845 [Moorena producens JHB]|uniref:Uncharacterized protein n=1 Tax=Moorena producens (strain JHB) TaxID=1454205 RepID=A0A1D9G640_MOOP1|nr:hypothetical protein [Moorena producens]AOY82994.1 hypothetical protein BJP36_26845 [Moorena producens JHB]